MKNIWAFSHVITSFPYTHNAGQENPSNEDSISTPPIVVNNQDQNWQTISFTKRNKLLVKNSKGTTDASPIAKVKTFDVVSRKFFNPTSSELSQAGSTLPTPIEPKADGPVQYATSKPFGSKAQGKAISGMQPSKTWRSIVWIIKI